MTTEELKLEAIKKAYGEYYCTLKEYIDNDGWCENTLDGNIGYSPSKIGFTDDYDLKPFSFSATWRPKSLSGIETNNSWIRIEEDGSNLPSLGYYWVKNRENGEIYNSTIDPKRREDMIDWFSHYQPIIQPQTPIF